MSKENRTRLEVVLVFGAVLSTLLFIETLPKADAQSPVLCYQLIRLAEGYGTHPSYETYVCHEAGVYAGVPKLKDCDVRGGLMKWKVGEVRWPTNVLEIHCE